MANGRCSSSETLLLRVGLIRFQSKNAMISTSIASTTTRLAKVQARIFGVRVIAQSS